MEPILIYKALSNETRHQILHWLKNPAEHFEVQCHIPEDVDFKIGVCVGDIQAKAGMAQSVISGYLLTMQKAGLLESERVGQWTYYRRNEKTIHQFIEYVQKEL
ncbi:ArsR/SmtB family transcription factor [Peribacillus simplex]|uniref:ArsR/SmtB family transcription factor n=1 Tax=Peribacillus simplex TaxID=1478 RepID=UPI003811747A